MTENDRLVRCANCGVLQHAREATAGELVLTENPSDECRHCGAGEFNEVILQQS